MFKYLIAIVTLLMTTVASAQFGAIEYYQSRQGDLNLHLVGTGVAQNRDVPGFSAKVTTCFEGLQVIDMTSNTLIGTATDCVSKMKVHESGLVTVIGTTFLNLPQGTLVVQGDITLQPIGVPTKTAHGSHVSHITGSSQLGHKNSVVDGTGIYEGAIAHNRISGMVDMSKFKGKPGDTVEFSCFFVVSNIVLPEWLRHKGLPKGVPDWVAEQLANKSLFNR